MNLVAAILEKDLLIPLTDISKPGFLSETSEVYCLLGLLLRCDDFSVKVKRIVSSVFFPRYPVTEDTFYKLVIAGNAIGR